MFSLQAAVNLRLAQGSVSRITSEIKSGLEKVTTNVKAVVDPGSINQINDLAKKLAAVNTAVSRLNLLSSQAQNSVDRLAASSAKLTGGNTQALTHNQRLLKDLALAYDDTSNKIENFGRQVNLAGRRFIAFTIATTGLFALSNAFKNALKEAIEFDLQMNKLRQVSDEGASSITDLKDTILRLSTSLGVSSKELADAAVTITQAGIKASQAKVALEAFALALTAPNFDSAAQTVEGLIAVYQQFGKNVDNLKGQLGSINAVAGAFAVEAGDLIKAVQKAGGSFSTAGGSLEELLALMTAVRSTTRESADQIATGLRSIFTYVQRSETIDNLKSLGINLRYARDEALALGDANLENQFVGPYQAILRLSKGLKELRTTDPRYSQIVEDLGGVRQVSRVLPLIQQVGEAQKALNVARIGGASLEAAASIRQDAIANKLTKVSEAYQKLANNIVASKGFNDLVTGLTNIAVAFSKIVEAATPLLPVLGALASVKIAQGAASFATGFLTPNYYKPNNIKKFAGGGSVYGEQGIDKVPAMLTNGEYVVNAKDASKNLAALEAINSGKRVQFFNDGGYIKKYNNLTPEQKAIFDRSFSKNIVRAENDEKYQELFSGGGSDVGFNSDSMISTVANAIIRGIIKHGETNANYDNFNSYAWVRRDLGSRLSKKAKKQSSRRESGEGFGGQFISDIVEGENESVSLFDSRQSGTGDILDEVVARETINNMLASPAIPPLPPPPPPAPPAATPPEPEPEPNRNFFSGSTSINSPVSGSSPRERFANAYRAQRIANRGSNADSAAMAARSLISEPQLTPNSGESNLDFSRRAAQAGMSRSSIIAAIRARPKAQAATAESNRYQFNFAQNRGQPFQRPSTLPEPYDFAEDIPNVNLAIPKAQNLPPIGLAESPTELGSRVVADTVRKLTRRNDVKRDIIKDLGLGGPIDALGVGNAQEFGRLRKGIEDFSIANQDLAKEIFGALDKGIINTRQAQQLVNEANKNRKLDIPDITGGNAALQRQAARDAIVARNFSQEYVDLSGGYTPSRRRAFETFRESQTARGIGGSLSIVSDTLNQNFVKDAQQFGNLLTKAPQFLETLQNSRIEQAQRNLVPAIEAQVKALYKNIRAEDAKSLAQELAARAVRGQEKVLLDSRGSFAGLADLGTQLRDQGQNATGRNALGRFFNRFTGPDANIIGRLAGRAGQAISANGGTAAAIGLTAIGPLVSDYLDKRGNAANVISGGQSRETFNSYKGAAGILGGAATGAAFGLAFGPWGAAIGAATGAVVGLTTAMDNAAKEINEAKISNALNDLATKLNPIIEGNANYSSIDPRDIIRNIQEARESVRTKAIQNSDAEFLGFIGTNQKSLEANSRKGIRDAFAGQAGGFSTILAKEVTRFAQLTPNDRPVDVANRFANDKANTELIKIIADVRGTSFGTVLKEFTKDIADAQKSFLVEKEIGKVREELNRTATSFSRLSSAISNAAIAAKEFTNAGQINQLAFNAGTVGVQPLDELFSQLGSSTSKEFNKGLAPIVKAFNNNRFAQTGEVADTLSKNLPAILGDLAGSPLDFNESIDLNLRRQLEDLFIPKNIVGKDRNEFFANNPAIAQGIQTVIAGIREVDKKEKGNALGSINADASKFAEELLRPFVEPFKTEGLKIARELSENANRFVEGLSQYYRNVETINQNLNNLSELKLGSTRANALINSDILGGGDPNRLLTLAQLQQPFNDRQSRLLRGTNLGNTDINGITTRLNDVRGRLEAARTARDNAIGDKNLFPKLAKDFEILNQEANNLQQALRNLADPAQRAAAIQEKLNQLNQDRDNRLSYAERFITASPEERIRLNRGQLLARDLSQNPNRFANLTDDDKRLALEAARNIGVSQFANGMTGEGLRNLLLQQTGIVTPEIEKQRKDLLNQNAGVAGDAAKAQESLGKILETENNKFLANLAKTQDTFFARLEINLLKEAAAQQKQTINQNETTGRQLKQQKSDADFLAKLGVKSQDELELARKQVANINALTNSEAARLPFDEADVQRRLSEKDGMRLAALQSQLYIDKPRSEKIKGALTVIDSFKQYSGNLTEEQKTQLAGRFVDFGNQAGELSHDTEYFSTLLSNITRDFFNEINSKPNKYAAEIDRSGVLKGSDIEKLTVDQRSRLTNILENQFKGGDTLGNLTSRINENDAAFKRLTDNLNNLNTNIEKLQKAANATPAVNKAMGGSINSIFRPSGTDTIPAMLSRGEFIVNARSASNNMSLLKDINNSTGPVYMAKGGLVGVDPYGSVGLDARMKKIGERARKKFGEYKTLDEKGKLKYDEFLARGILKVNKERQLGSLLMQQAYAGTDDELAGSAIQRLNTREEQQFSSFKQKYASEFNSIVNRRNKFAKEAVEENLVRARGKKFTGFGFKRSSEKASIVGGTGFSKIDYEALDILRSLPFAEGIQFMKNYIKNFKSKSPFQGGFGPTNNFPAAGLVRRASGGLIGSNGTQDSILAALMPGEYVLNRNSVRSLGLNNVEKANATGKIDGQSVNNKWIEESAKLSQALTAFASPAGLLVSSFNTFNSTVDRFSQAIEKFPTNVEHNHKLTAEVIINGAEFLAKQNEEFQNTMVKYINSAITSRLEKEFPDKQKSSTSDNVI